MAHECLAIDIDETRARTEAPADYVLRMAQEKSAAGFSQRARDWPVLAADTTVVVDNDCLGKPADEAHALQMLQRLSGRSHQVYTAVALRTDSDCHCRISCSDVRFRELGPAEMQAYWCSGEPAGKAGGYAIQGRAAVFVEQLTGSYSGVMGLPLHDTYELLQLVGISFSDPQ